MISDADLLAEIQNDPQNIGFDRAGKRPIHQRINAPGSASVQAWVVSETPKPVSKELYLQQISSIQERAMLKRTRNSGSDIGDTLDFDLTESTIIDMAHPDNRAFVQALTAVDDVPVIDKPLKTATRDAILRLGEVEMSRAQEINSGESISLEQIERVLSNG